MSYQTKIKSLEKKIQAYQAQYPKRDDKQKNYLNCLWLELAFWQLVQEGKVKLNPLWPKAEKSWEHLKEIYRKKGQWPKSRLRLFLLKQKPEYTGLLIKCIQRETNPKYLELAQWLMVKDKPRKKNLT